MSSSRERTLAVLWIVVANVVGGLSYPAQKAAIAGLSPTRVTAVRNLVALAALACFGPRLLRSLRLWSRREIARGALLGTLAFALPMWLGIVGVERSSAANASILILLEPVTIVAIAALVLGEKIGAVRILCIALGLAGALCIVLQDVATGTLSAGDLAGVGLLSGNALLALHGILWGLYTPLAKPLVERHGAIGVSFLATLASSFVLVPAALLEREPLVASPELASALSWSVGLGLCVSFLGTVLWLAALRHISASSVAGFVFLQPLSGVLAGVWFLGERLTTAGILGGLLIVLGVALDILLTSRAREDRDGAPVQASKG